MICPRCGTGLSPDTHRNVALDICRGMFLDHGELNRVAEPTAGDLKFSTVHEETFTRHDVYSGIILDDCERCSGFWLDGKELDHINEEEHKLNDAVHQPAHSFAHWFTLFLWSLPR